MSGTKKPYNFINIARGFAIFVMLWGHCIQVCIPSNTDFFENSVFQAIYSFHMPLFILISGYLFRFSFEKRKLKELLVQKTQSFLHIIVFCSIFFYFTTAGIIAVLERDFAAVFNGDWLPSLTRFWFIWSILALSVTVAVVCKRIKKVWLQILLLFVGSLFILLFPHGVYSLYLYPYFILGFYFAKYKSSLPKWFICLKYVSLPVFPVLLLFYEKKHFIYTSGLFGHGQSLTASVKIDSFRWMIGFFGCLFVLVVLEALYRIVSKTKLSHLFFGGFSALGEKSLQVYVLNTILLEFYFSMLYKEIIALFPKLEVFFSSNPWLYNLGFTLLLSVLFSFVLYGVVKLLEKARISRFLFGR